MRFQAVLVAVAVVGFPSGALQAQARLVEIVPEGATIQLESLGSMGPVPAVIGTDIEPGDLLTSAEARTKLECPPGSSVEVLLSPPFRILVDVSDEHVCTIDLMAGDVDVLTEEPTEVTSGGVEMGSIATQYSVGVSRGGGQPRRTLVVFDGAVDVRRAGEAEPVRVDRGSKLVAVPMVKPLITTMDDSDIKRAAVQYAVFDLAAATRAGKEIDDLDQARLELTALHSKVLSNPDATDSRVALARMQIGLDLRGQAVQQLERANVIDPDRLHAYEIDPSILDYRRRGGNPSAPSGLTIIDPNDAGRVRAPTAHVVEQPTRALALIESGRYEEALEVSKKRIEAGSAGSLDYYAMTRALLGLGDHGAVAKTAEKALEFNAADQGLTERQVSDLQAVLRRYR